MNERVPPGEIVKSARQARRMSQAELASRIGANQQTIDKIEKGKIQHSRYFHGIAQELSIPMEKLIPDWRSTVHNGPAQTPIPDRELRSEAKTLPVHAAARGGPGEMIVSADPVDWVVRPAPLATTSRGYGIIVVGESMLPEFEPGDVALINPHLPPVGGHTYVFYAEREGEARATIKRLVRASDSLWHVEQWNPSKGQHRTFTLSRKEWAWAHRVVGKYSR